ncbi:MAG: SPASM domain-containing protein [Lachnospiraceae bacterium]|nr:SPASM domain-containing protein [Lachnospiraceae bacterium]
MPIRIHNFAGILGWNARKYFPRLASESYLKLQFVTRGKSQQKYIEYFLRDPENPPRPNVINLETINRCNSTCEFCTANKNADKRPYKRMEDTLFYSIIDQLHDWDYRGHLTLYGNNEPWLDTRIVDFHKYAREKLPDAFIFMSTNGLLLNIEKVKQIVPHVNQLVINNYCLDMKLHDNIKEVYDYVKAHPDEFRDVDILIQMRYLKEVLTNRAGSAPNKKATNKVIKETCLMPFTDMWIMPNGKLGICCCDDFEVTDFGDLHELSIQEAWNSPKYQELRLAIRDGRQNYPFCRHCDFIDAGLRMDLVDDILNDREAVRGSRQSIFKKKSSRRR